MSNRHARILAAGGAAVLVAALGIPAALAAATAKTWTVQPGGAVRAQAISGLSTRFTFTDTKTGSVTPCSSATASGKLRSGSGLPGSDAGWLSAVSIPRCVAPGGGPIFTLQPASLPWHVNFSSYNAARGVVRGTISHMGITTSSPQGCSMAIDGTSADSPGKVAFRYTDSTGRLTLLPTDNLHFYDVSSGCLGGWNDNDPATLSATYTVSPKQAITSP